MPLDPDTEIQYRRGGKIMKKMPRKFQAGGATPAPAPSSDRVPPAEAAKMKAEKEQREREKKEQEAGQRRPNLGKLFKKGGKVRKFNGEDGSVVEQPELREEREGKDIYYTGRFKGEDGDEIYRRAYAQANRLTTPSGAEETGGRARTGLKEPSVRKAASKPTPKAIPKVSVAPSKRAEEAPKEAPKAEAPKETAKAEAPKRGLYERGAGPMLPSPTKLEAPGGATAFERRREERLQREAKERMEARKNRTFGSEPKEKDPYEGMSPSEKSLARGAALKRMLGIKEEMKKGGVVKKYAKGGGVEAKGKTKGKIVKMAKGGSVRGYGISKVTNKTKYV